MSDNGKNGDLVGKFLFVHILANWDIVIIASAKIMPIVISGIMYSFWVF